MIAVERSKAPQAAPARPAARQSPGSGSWSIPLLALQRAAGNAAVASLLAQRLPVVSRYESGEHAQAGDAGKVVAINGVKVNEGDLVALGDLFEKPADIYKSAPAELQKLVDLIERDKQAFTGVAGVKKVTNAEWSDATKGRPKAQQYLEMAKRNDSHFAPQASGVPTPAGDHKSSWRSLHQQAISQTIEANAAGKPGVPDEAIVTNGFAAHFLTDAFSAGHLVNKDDAMQKAKDQWKTQKFDGMIFKESNFTKQVAAKVLGNSTVAAIMAPKELKMAAWDVVNAQRFSEFIYQMADSKPELFFNAFGRLVHDKLNQSILDPKTAVEVQNGRGDKWVALAGDETLAKSPETLTFMKAAVAESDKNLEAVAKLKTSPGDLEPYFKAVWDFTPVPTAAGKANLDSVVAAYTDPKNPKCVDAFAELAIIQIETLVSELTSQGYMRDRPPPMPMPRDNGPKF